MPKIKFTKGYAVKGKGGESYKEGQVVEVSERSAQHFFNRGAAEPVDGDKPKPEAAKAEPPKAESGPSRQAPDPVKTDAKPRGK